MLSVFTAACSTAGADADVDGTAAVRGTYAFSGEDVATFVGEGGAETAFAGEAGPFTGERACIWAGEGAEVLTGDGDDAFTGVDGAIVSVGGASTGWLTSGATSSGTTSTEGSRSIVTGLRRLALALRVEAAVI